MSQNKAMTEEQLKVFGECYSNGKKMPAIMYGNMSFGNFVFVEELDMFVDWEEFQWGLTPDERKEFVEKYGRNLQDNKQTE